MSEEKPLHVVALQVENVKRIQAVTIRPDGNVVVIGGQNAQGKTSLIDSLEMAFGGGKTIPAEPVRRGARKARIVADLGEIVVERTFSPKGTALEVRNADGVPQKSPQALLDKLCSRVAFDPLSFAREEPKKQDAILKQVLGLDFSDIDARREQAYAERTQVNREAKQLSARLDALPVHAGVPDQEVSVAELSAELERMRDEADENRNKRELADVAADASAEAWDAVESKKAAIEELKAALAKAEAALPGLEKVAQEKGKAAVAAQEVADNLVDPDPEPTRQQIATAEETNRKVRSNLERKGIAGQLRMKEGRADELTAIIEAADAEKAERLAAAKFPVEGLGFDETGPTLNGIPLEQASQAERLRVSVAIGAALHPRVRVMLVRDGSLLDDNSMRLLAELAAETGSQLWVEKVSSDGAGCSVLIEDGMVVGSQEAAQ